MNDLTFTELIVTCKSDPGDFPTTKIVPETTVLSGLEFRVETICNRCIMSG